MSEVLGRPQMIRLVNQDNVEDYIRRNGPATRPEIAVRTGLSLVTVNKAVQTLLADKKIKAYGLDSGSRGRRAMSFAINEKLCAYVFIFVYQNNCDIDLVNHIGVCFYSETIVFRDGCDSGFLEELILRLKAIFSEYETVPFRSIYMGVPGVVSDGLVDAIPRLPELHSINLKASLEEQFGLEVYIENDINLVTYGLWIEAGDVENIKTFLFLNKGVRMGSVIERSIYRGNSYFAGEIGEVFTTQDALDKITYEKVIEILSSTYHLAKGKEKLLLKDRLLKLIVEIVHIIIATINPELLIIDCTLIEQEDLVVITDHLAKHIAKQHIPNLQILKEEIQTLGKRGMTRLALERDKESYM